MTGPTTPRRLIAISILSLLWLLAARVSGPSDLWDHTQPRTISYTTDIIVNGGTHWVLPVERGVEPATKPPLYNWLAVPAVMALGFNSEIAHKLPSIIAICLCWLVVVRLGRSIDSHPDQSLGWLAGMILAANYPMFKLGYLARPDMLLTLWLLLAWALATTAIVERDRPRDLRAAIIIAAYWICIALAGLTKGPAALVGLLYALLAARVMTGSWSEIRILRPFAGFPLCLLLIGLWVYGVWRLNPEHLQHELWFNEIYGRVTGLGPKGNRNGPPGWIKDLPLQSLYYLVRFLPWSLPSIAAMAVLFRRLRSRANDGIPVTDATSQWMLGAMVQVVVVVGLFTLSTGKRADYIAAAFPPGALLGAWWLLRAGAARGVRQPWFAPAVAGLVMLAITVVDRLERNAPVPGFGREIRQFADETTARIRQEPLPITFLWTGEATLQALLGGAEAESKEAVLHRIEQGKPFWLVAGRRDAAPNDFADWIRSVRVQRLEIETAVRSAMLPREDGWPEQVTLYRITPLGGEPRRRAPHP